jgi:hypothetical protein
LTIEVLFVLATGLVKVSILLFFRRLGSRGVSKAFRIITWIAIGFTISSTIAFFISPFVGCRPLSAYWEQSDVTKILQGVEFKCNDEGAAVTAAGVISTVQDLITALLPNFIYWKAQIPFRQKAALMAIFATAYGVAAFGALRTHATWVLFYETYDVSWQLWDLRQCACTQGLFQAVPQHQVYFVKGQPQNLTSQVVASQIIADEESSE